MINFLLYFATSFFLALINEKYGHPISLGFMRFVNSDLWCRNWVRNLSFQGKGCSDCLGFPQSCLLRGAKFRGIFEWGVYLYGGEIWTRIFLRFLGKIRKSKPSKTHPGKDETGGQQIGDVQQNWRLMWSRHHTWIFVILYFAFVFLVVQIFVSVQTKISKRRFFLLWRQSIPFLILSIKEEGTLM